MADKVGQTMMEARAAFPGMQIESTAFGQALAQSQHELAWEQLKTQKEMFVVEEQRRAEEAVLKAAMTQWVAKMRALTKGAGTRRREFPYNETLRAFELKRDLITDADNRIKDATVGAARSFGPRLNYYKQLLQMGDLDGAKEQAAILDRYYTELQLTRDAFSTAGLGFAPKVMDVEGTMENINIEVLNTPMSALASTALNNAKQSFTGETQIKPSGQANFITAQQPATGIARIRKEPDWWGWTRNNMPDFVRYLLVELSDRLNEKLDTGMLTDQEAVVLNRLNAMGDNWNEYAEAFTESVMNPGASRSAGKSMLVDEALSNAGIRTEIFGYVAPEHREAVSMLQQYANVEAFERGMVEDYAHEYPMQFQEYAKIKNAVGMIDERTNAAYLVNLDNLRKMQMFEYEDRMRQTGLDMIRDFRGEGLLDRLMQYSPGVTDETIMTYINDVSDARVMGEKERAREILMGKPGEFEGLVDLWFDNENVTPDFIADFTDFFYKYGVLESYNPLKISGLAERYRALDIFTEEEKEQATKFSRERYGTSGAEAILEFLRARNK